MDQDTLTAERPSIPPPVPLRSHLRNGSAYQLKLRAIKSDIEKTSTTALSSPVSRGLLEEIDRELTDTQERLVSAILEGREMHGDADRFSWQTWEENEVKPNRRRMGRSPEELFSVREFFMNEMESEMSYEHDRPEPLQMGRGSAASSVCCEGRDQQSVDGVVEVMGHVRTRRGSYDAAPSHHTTTNLSGEDENFSPSSQSSREKEMDTKVEDWLARGFLPATSPAVGHSRRVINSALHESGAYLSSQHDEDLVCRPENLRIPPGCSTGSDRAFPTRQPALSLFPPKSAVTGNREYTPPNSPFARPVCPMSPLGNGRDAYGNYITTNSRDYFAAQSSPTSPHLHSTSEVKDSSAPTSLRAIRLPERGLEDRAVPEGEALSTTSKLSPIVHLRGGGWIKPFWRAADAGEGNQAPTSPPQHRPANGYGVARDVPAVNHMRRTEGRTVSSVQSQFSVPRPREDPRTTGNTHARPSARDGERQDIRDHGEHITSFDRPKTHDSANTEGSSEYRARVDKVLGAYGGFFAPSSPTVLTSGDKSLLTQNPAIYGATDIPDDSKRPALPIVNRRPLSDDTADSWESHETASTVRSHETSPRVEKRWNRGNPPPPPRDPPPVPPKYLFPEPLPHGYGDEDELSTYSDDSDHRPAPSVAVSTTTANDPLRDLPDLQTSKAYRNVAHAREVERIEKLRRLHEEQDHKFRERILREQRLQAQEPDPSTIVPGNSISEMITRQRLVNVRQVELIPPLVEQHCRYSPAPPSLHVSRYVHTPVNSRPAQQGHHPAIIPIPVAPAQPGRPRKSSMQKARSTLGKISRLILAAPSDPELKTYSRRYPLVYPPVEKTRQPLVGAQRSEWHPPMDMHVNVAPPGMIAPPPALGWRERRRSKDKPQQIRKEKERDSPTGMRAGNLRTGIFKRDKGKGKVVEETPSIKTEVREFAPRDTRMKDLPSIPLATQAVRLGYPRSGPPPKQDEPAAEPPEPKYQTPRVRGEVLPFDENLGYPAHWRLNEFYGHADQDKVTGTWADRVAQLTKNERVPLRGGGGGEPSSLAAHHSLLTHGAYTEEAEAVKHGDIDKLLMSSTHLGLDEATLEALAGAERGTEEEKEEEVANMRSSWSTDSTIEEMREKRRRQNAWREEDTARAMAMAMRL